MSKRPKAAPAKAHTPRTIPADVGEGRSPSIELASAVAIEAANRAAGFDPPPAAQAVIDRADPAELETARKAVADAPIVAPDDQTPTDQPEGGEPATGQQE